MMEAVPMDYREHYSIEVEHGYYVSVPRTVVDQGEEAIEKYVKQEVARQKLVRKVEKKMKGNK